MRNGIVWANGFDAEIFVCFPKAYYSYVEGEQAENYAKHVDLSANKFLAEFFVCFPKAYYSYVEREQTEIYAQIRKPSTVVPVPDCLIRACVFTFLAVVAQIIIKVNTDFIKNRLVGNAKNGFFGAGVNALATAIAKFFFNFVRHKVVSFTFNSLG